MEKQLINLLVIIGIALLIAFFSKPSEEKMRVRTLVVNSSGASNSSQSAEGYRRALARADAMSEVDKKYHRKSIVVEDRTFWMEGRFIDKNGNMELKCVGAFGHIWDID